MSYCYAATSDCNHNARSDGCSFYRFPKDNILFFFEMESSLQVSQWYISTFNFLISIAHLYIMVISEQCII